ncbi:MAG: hypothetical protein ACRDJM_03535 [Actinomycetota bacterium]
MLIDDFRRLNETMDAALVPAVYATDSILDSNVPEWRFQRKGTDEIAGQYREWASEISDLRVAAFTAHEAPWGFVVELEQRYRADDDDCLSRQIHLLKVSDGKVTEQKMYCTGVWSSETIKRQAAEAPMV